MQHGIATHWAQIKALTKANLKSRYRNTMAGFFWVVLNPVILFGVQGLVFRRFLKLEMHNYLLFLLTGLLPWIFISQSLDMCTSLFVATGPVMKAFSVHPLVFLSAQLLDNLINFLAAFLLVLIPLSFDQHVQVTGVALMPLCFVVLLTGVFGMVWAAATLQALLRDTRFVVTFLISIAFFLTPIFYPREFVPENLRFLIDLNPLHRLIEPFRHSLYVFEPALFVRSIAEAAVVAMSAVAAAYFLWRKKENAVYLAL